MAITATSQGGGHYEPVPEGNYIARCYQMIHIGTVMDTFQGENKLTNKVRVTWELPTECKSFKDGEPERPYSIGKDFTLSLNEKATLRKFLESWRGKAFSEAEARSFDVTKLIGAPCMLNVIHKTSKTGKLYAEIAGVAKMPKGIECPDQVNETFVFHYEPFEQWRFDTLPDWMKDKVRSSLEYQAAVNPSHTVAAPSVESADDDLPF